MKKCIFILLFFHCFTLFGQQSNNNIITTALPFLELDPNPRTIAIGEIGVVSSTYYRDAGVAQNPALLSGDTRVIGGLVSYSKWMNNIVSDFSLSGFKGYFSIDRKNTVSINFTSFLWANMVYTDEQGYPSGNFRPWEFSIGANYARQLSKAISLGAGIKYARSKMFEDNTAFGDYTLKPIRTYAVDLGIQYKKSLVLSEQSKLNYHVGCAINNFGPKVSYNTNPGERHEFIPTNLSLGILLNPEFKLDDDISLNIDLAYQVEKLLVPTPPKYSNTTDSIVEGLNPDISPFQALFQSFYDAPGGYKEELNEITHKFGGEARINFSDKVYVALRGGKYVQHETKGGKNNTTLGFGVGVYGFTLDYSTYKGKSLYLVDTWMLSVGFRTRLDKVLRF
jgi:hypothetical protein